MKKSLLLAWVALSLTASGALAAPGEWVGGIQGGAHIPSSEYDDRFSTGWTGGVTLDYMVNDMFALGGHFELNSANAESDSVPAGTDIRATVYDYGIHANLFFMKEGMVRPYLAATVGAYSSKLKAEGTFNGETDGHTVMGFGGGVGLRIQTPGSPIGFGVEGLYHNVGEAFEVPATSTPPNLFGRKNFDAQYIDVVAKITFSFSDKTQAQ